MKGTQSIYKSFKTEQQIRAFFKKGSPVHCVSCKSDLSGDEDIDYELHNTQAISLTKANGEPITAVPRMVCPCGYKNTLIKLLYQTI